MDIQNISRILKYVLRCFLVFFRGPRSGPPPFPHELKAVESPIKLTPSVAPGNPNVIDYGHRPVPLKANATGMVAQLLR